MKKVIIFCSGAEHFRKKLKYTKFDMGKNIVEIFPDGEFRQRFSENINLKGKDVFIVQSFYTDDKFDVNDRIFEVLTAFENAKSLGAKNVYLIAPYFPYLREDKRFEKNEAITAKVMANLCEGFKKVFIFEPHLHRFKKFSEFFPNAVRVSLSEFVNSQIKKLNFSRDEVLLIGPDSESEIWVKSIKKKFGFKSTILKKKRISPRKVLIKITCDFKHDKIILIDDIISTGKTLCETIKQVKCKKNYCFVFHGIFSDKPTCNFLTKNSVVFVTNSIPVKNKKIKIIDISNKIGKIVKDI